MLLRAAGQTSRHLAAAGRLSKLLRGAPRMCASGVQLEAVAARTLPCELPILMVPSLGGTLERAARKASTSSNTEEFFEPTPRPSIQPSIAGMTVPW